MVKNKLGKLLLLITLPIVACSTLSPEATPTVRPDGLSDSESQTSQLSPKEVDPQTTTEGTQPEDDVSGTIVAPGQDNNQQQTPTVSSQSQHEWPAPAGPFEPFTSSKVTPEEMATYEKLNDAHIPERDDIELARLYEGWSGDIPPVLPVTEPISVGKIEQINVLNHDSVTIDPISAKLLLRSEHAYFWFDLNSDLERFSQRALNQIGEAFDQIYERSVALFGSEANPGVDGDPRLHIVNTVPEALCDDGLQCSIAGYFSSNDAIPEVVDPESNAREMFVMNVDYFGSDFYINVLAHELRHMIEENYDSGDTDWEVEGAAMLAEDLLGYTENATIRANQFLGQPDQQLNSWTDGNTSPYYGQGYLLNRYIFDRLGQDFYLQFATNQDDGLQAITSTARGRDLDITGIDLWLDWLVTLALHDNDATPQEYQFGVSGLDKATMNQVDSFPADVSDTVNQFAADYYAINSAGVISIDFKGSALVPLLDTMPSSGQWMWMANRGNYGHATLSRSIDLTTVDTATLEYDVYYDIEAGYDFAYLFISTDSGLTWQPLSAEHMAEKEADPSNSALADRFYTDRSEEWLNERIDLSPYVGQEVMIRFAYVTDPILTQGGIGIDNIAIPEINFFDDVESDVQGWIASGFERVTATIPQSWHIILVTFESGIPVIEPLAVSLEGGFSRVVEQRQTEDPAILIVAASAPETLQPAYYQLTIAE